MVLIVTEGLLRYLTKDRVMVWVCG